MTGMVMLASVIYDLHKKGLTTEDFFIDGETGLLMEDFYKFRKQEIDKISIYFDPNILKEKKLKPKDVKITNLRLFTQIDKWETFSLLRGYTKTDHYSFLAMPIKSLNSFGIIHGYRRLLEVAGSVESMTSIIPEINKRLTLVKPQ